MIVPCKDNEKRDYMFFCGLYAGFAVRPESGFMRRSGRGPRLRVAVRREKRGTVSYTHLDVYKRQEKGDGAMLRRAVRNVPSRRRIDKGGGGISGETTGRLCRFG